MGKLPDTPLLISGCVGGPLVIFACTPLRNGLTLGSQDIRSTAMLLYKKTFRGGFQAGWTGGLGPAIAACPQFLALSPVYHYFNGQLQERLGCGPKSFLTATLASVGAGVVETFLTFGPQSRNAQMAYNKSFVQFSSLADGGRRALKLNSAVSVWGPGAGAMSIRNVISIGGARVLSPWLQENVPADWLSPSARAPVCDISSSLLCSPISAPVHQLFNFLVTTPEARNMPFQKKWRLARKFLCEQYFKPLPRETIVNPDIKTGKTPLPKQEYSWRLSRIAVRDLTMRGVYITSVFSLFMSIERFLCATLR